MRFCIVLFVSFFGEGLCSVKIVSFERIVVLTKFCRTPLQPKGFADGKEKGFAEGKTKGFADGKEKGFAEGSLEERSKIAKSLYANGVPLEIIMRCSGFSEEEIKNL